MKHTKIGLAAADLVLPQRYLYASSSLQMWRREFCRVRCIGDHSLFYIG